MRNDGGTALCHEWTTVYGGSEQVASRLAEILKAVDVFTFAAEPKLARQLFPSSRIHAHQMGLSTLARRHWPWFLPLMPRAWSRLDLSAYDVVLTSAHACVNAVRVRPDAIHISYCHTPMRYAWDWRIELGRIPSPIRPLWPMVAAALRRADRDWASRVTVFIANSHHVAARIRACYGREATVVHPPVDTGFWSPDPRVGREGFFLFVGRLVSYKRADVAVRAARLAGVELTIAGGGPELQRLRRMADDQVRFIECPSREVLRDLYRRCSALLNPGVEDFGMTMAEAQACGTPVIAQAAGGAREIVVDNRTGVLYQEASPQSLGTILRDFEPRAFDPGEARSNAERFAPDRFDEGVLRVIEALTGGRPQERRESVGIAGVGQQVSPALAGQGGSLVAEEVQARAGRGSIPEQGARPVPRSSADSYDESYFVGGSRSNYQDYGDVEAAIDKGFMPEVRRHAAVAGAGKHRKAYLDVGCAFGYYVERLARLGWETAGVDISAYAIGRGRARGVANLHVARAQDLPFPDGAFDFLTAIDVIEHIPPEDSVRMVAETRRVLRTGGVALFATPNFLTNRYWNIHVPQFKDPDETHINYQSVESLRALLANFARCDIYGHTPFPDQLYAFDQCGSFGNPFLRLWPIRSLTRLVAWKLLGRRVEFSSYLHAIAVK